MDEQVWSPGDPVDDKVVDAPATPVVDNDGDSQYTNGQEDTPSVDLKTDEARKEGWVPLEEFRGDKSKWVDAEEWLRRGEILRPMKEKLHRIERERELERRQMMAAMRDIQQAKQREMEAKVAEIEAKQKAAFEAGDYNSWQAAEKVKREIEAHSQPVSDPYVEEEAKLVAEDFKRANPWFERDAEASNRVREFVDFKMAKLGPNATPRDFGNALAEASAMFAPKMRTTPQPPPVAGAVNRNVPPKLKADTRKFSELSAEDRATFDYFARRGIYKNTDEGRARFAAEIEDTSPFVAK